MEMADRWQLDPFFVFDTQMNGSWGGNVFSFCPTKNIKKCCDPGSTAAISSSLVNSPQRRCTSCASASRHLGREHVEHVTHKTGGAAQICCWQIGKKLSQFDIIWLLYIFEAFCKCFSHCVSQFHMSVFHSKRSKWSLRLCFSWWKLLRPFKLFWIWGHQQSPPS